MAIILKTYTHNVNKIIDFPQMKTGCFEFEFDSFFEFDIYTHTQDKHLMNSD